VAFVGLALYAWKGPPKALVSFGGGRLTRPSPDGVVRVVARGGSGSGPEDGLFVPSLVNPQILQLVAKAASA